MEAFSVIQSIETPDDKTVAITISEPSNEFISYMTTAVLPADYDKQDTDPVGTGPFKFVSRTAQDSVVLEKFKEYWSTPAQLDKVTLKITNLYGDVATETFDVIYGDQPDSADGPVRGIMSVLVVALVVIVVAGVLIRRVL